MLEMKVGKADDAMDWLTFISSIVGSIAWPIAAFAIAFLFRVQIIALLSRIKTLRMGDNAVDFRDKLEEAEAVVEAAPEVTLEVGPVIQQPPIASVGVSGPSVINTSERNSTTSKNSDIATPAEAQQDFSFGPRVMQNTYKPIDMVLTEWNMLIKDLIRFSNETYDENRVSIFSHGQMLRIAKRLADDGYISHFAVKLLEDLQELRHKVTYEAADITRSDARRFKSLAHQFRHMLTVGTANTKPDNPDS